jgi:16S rRNA (uracil1498-N3)-methyltransferase
LKALNLQGFFISSHTDMALPFFYRETLGSDTMVLEEDTSKHITGVLRMKVGEELLLTDGKGTKGRAVITDDHRKRCVVKVVGLEQEPEPQPNVTIALSLVKNAARFEWFLEKATEIGVRRIIPLLCERTEKEKFRHDRLKAILISAMLQSQQCWLPHLSEPASFEKVVEVRSENRFIAHCLPQQKQSLNDFTTDLNKGSLILIGPEGDFTQKEIDSALQKGFHAVSLGDTRLRTETAGMVAAALLCNL